MNNTKSLQSYIDELILESNLFVPRGLDSRKEKEIRIINQKIQKYINDGFIGDLNLFESSIIDMPSELIKVGGNLNLELCRSLKSLPNNLHVGGDALLYKCTSLKSLPNNLHVGGHLNLNWCRSLESLPNNLHVGGHLNLTNTKIVREYDTRKLVDEYLKSINATIKGVVITFI